MRKLAVATVSLVLLAISSTFAQAAPPLQFVGVVDNNVWVADPLVADAHMQAIVDAGFNSVRIFVPYTRGQAELFNDALSLCSAAMAAQKYNTTLFITVVGFKKTDDGVFVPGLYPQTASAQQKFITTLVAYAYNLAGPNGCAKDVHDVYFSVLNEVNTPTYFRPQKTKDGSWVAPGEYIRLLARVFSAMKTAAVQISQERTKADGVEVNINIYVIAGELAASHDPLGFIRAMCVAKSQQQIYGLVWDMFGFHPYPGGQIGVDGAAQLNLALQACGQPVTPLLYSEFGLQTPVPANLSFLYSGTENSRLIVSEDQQAELFHQALATAVCQPNVMGFFNFHLFDDQSLTDWQSGLYYADRVTKKSSYDSVRQSVMDARAGSIANC